MQQVIDIPECVFCHSKALELFYSKESGLIVECDECGYSRVATNEHIDSEVITLLAARICAP
jgi:Zn ribbon nucleic-acid-binding protein